MDNDLDKFLAVLELQVEIVKNTNVLNPPNSTWTREETNRCLNTLCETFRGIIEKRASFCVFMYDF